MTAPERLDLDMLEGQIEDEARASGHRLWSLSAATTLIAALRAERAAHERLMNLCLETIRVALDSFSGLDTGLKQVQALIMAERKLKP